MEFTSALPAWKSSGTPASMCLACLALCYESLRSRSCELSGSLLGMCSRLTATEAVAAVCILDHESMRRTSRQLGVLLAVSDLGAPHVYISMMATLAMLNDSAWKMSIEGKEEDENQSMIKVLLARLPQ